MNFHDTPSKSDSFDLFLIALIITYFKGMKNRFARVFCLSAFDQHFFSVNISLVMPHICWGAALQLKSSTKRKKIYFTKAYNTVKSTYE